MTTLDIVIPAHNEENRIGPTLAAYRARFSDPARDFVFDVDLLYLAHRLGYQIVEVPTIWFDKPGARVQLSGDAGR